jgi:hypothetical protein
VCLDRRGVREERQGWGRKALQGGIHRDDVQDEQIDWLSQHHLAEKFTNTISSRVYSKYHLYLSTMI